MLRAYTLLGALATATSTIQLSTLVTATPIANPGDAGETGDDARRDERGVRCWRSVPAGTSSSISRCYEFGTFHRPFRAPRGVAEHHRADAARAAPRGRRQVVPGARHAQRAARPRRPSDHACGVVEKKTFGLAARYADHLNVICATRRSPASWRRSPRAARRPAATRQPRDELPRGRDHRRERRHGTGSAEAVPAQDRRRSRQPSTRKAGRRPPHGTSVGTPRRRAEQIQRRVLDKGIDGITVNPRRQRPHPGHSSS